MAKPPQVARGSIPDKADPHAILGVRRGCTEREVRVAFRRKARKLHPDKIASRCSCQDRRASDIGPNISGESVAGDTNQQSSMGVSTCEDDKKCHLCCKNHDAFVTLADAYRALVPRHPVSETTLICELRAERNKAIAIKRCQLKSLKEFFSGQLHEDEISGSFGARIFTCRCGEDLIIEEEDLFEGASFLECTACSLTYRVED